MTITANTDFQTYQGDSVAPIFTVVNAAGLPIDISGVNDIIWTVRRNDSAAAVLTKTLRTSGVLLTAGGADGRFTVNLTGADTTPLSGYYVHIAVIIDAGGNQSTVTIGRMQIGLPPSWSYDSTKLSTTPIYQVRVLLGDNVEADQQFTDEEIGYALMRRSNWYGAAGLLARALAAKYARSCDMSAGDTKISFSQMSKGYRQQALDFELLAATSGSSGAGGIYAGGISVQDKQTQEQNTDRVQPQFNIAMQDNTLPVGQVGNELLDDTSNDDGTGGLD